MQEPRPNSAYWRESLRLQALLLVIWFSVSFGLGIFLVEPLNEIMVGGFPLGFWFSQQGAIYVFVILTFVYAWRMDRIDARYRSAAGSGSAESSEGTSAPGDEGRQDS